MEWRATYRLQLGSDLDFRQARALVPYLSELGISHLYLSPSFQARSGSTHGYDVVDPTRISHELGGEEEFRALCSAGLGVLLDIVPNHMATSEQENPYWSDPTRRAKFFDWDPETGWYRRFFTIDDLSGVRQEDAEVFEETHRKLFELIADGLVHGVRVDHPDGLRDPAGYLESLRARGARHVWVEKILEPGERLRDWPVEGTTGYEFANDVTALFVDPAGEEPLTELYAELTGERRSFADVAYEAKLEQARGDFRREFDRLRTLVDRRDVSLEEAAALLHVYRTYVEPWSGKVEPEDRDALAALPDELRRILLLEERGYDEFVTRFQQTTGPVMAKGVEDTALYRWLRLTALNEVGGNPDRFSLPIDEFHAANAERAERFPLQLLATQTHDTKRSGDVRARIGALAVLAGEWAERARRWRILDDPNENYLLLQTLVGAWPIAPERVEAYMEKALREAKLSTNWAAPNVEHERRVREAIRRFYADPPDDFEPFAARVAAYGASASVAQTLLKLTVPGVPDIYQGDEWESLNLVDPDNRRPVAWRARRRPLAHPPPKVRVIRRALDLRRRRPRPFAGAYTALDAGRDVCAFVRGDSEVLVAVPLRPAGRDARLEAPAGRWRDVLSGRDVELYGGERLRDLPGDLSVTLLERR
ncbi:MAG: malto-oligosyltrehalose synthase [Thermoleophilia bacterium]|nr:malto-oligosyltrehalose synthase [Thermoleophilia bacterium]